MAEGIVSYFLRQFFPLVFVEEENFVTGFERDFQDIKDEFESIQALLKDADAKDVNYGVQIWTKQLRKASFRMEDVIDEYNMHVAQRLNHSGFVDLFKKISQMILNLKSRYHIASEIHEIKLSLAKIEKRSASFVFESESGTSKSRGVKAARFVDPQTNSYFNDEVVGFEATRDELVRFLVEGTNELMLVSVVGMGGLGKTTLAKYVFDNPQVKNHFGCRFYISASQFNTAEELFIYMINKFCEDSDQPVPTDLKEMGNIALTDHVKQYLESKQYLILFDDVRKVDFSDGIEHAMTDNNRGSRIIVTTRMMSAAKKFQRSFHDRLYVHKLNPLADDKALELFFKKAFRGGECPIYLKDMSAEIVKQCAGLPLAIVTIGGILSTRPKTIFEWRKVSKNLGMELGDNVHFNDLATILSWSYDDLPWHLKLCMLYFGIYPENYNIDCKRLTRQWIAEGFVNCDGGRTLEEVSEEYLNELIQASLVQVSSVGFDGKVKSCQVHNILHHILIGKMKDQSFCHIMYDNHEQVIVDITRRFSIATFSSNVLRSNSNPGIRAIFVFAKEEVPTYFIDGLSIKFKLIKVLNFEHSLLNYVPENLGNLFHLKYLNLSHTKVTVLPKSIGNLPNLETLDLRQTKVRELPMEIKNLTKLRDLTCYFKYKWNYSTMNDTTGVQMQEGIGCLKSLQNFYFLEADHGGINRIQELTKLNQLKKLGIRCVESAHGNALCAAIGAMAVLESLSITAKAEEEILDLNILDSESVPHYLRVINIKARLRRFPDWIAELEYLVKIVLSFSKFEYDPLDSLKTLPNLSRLNLWDDAFAGESLHFKVQGFPKLKELDLTRLNNLSSVTIEKGALLGLDNFIFNNISQLKVVPSDLKHLENLQYLGFVDMPPELVESIDPNKSGQCHWIINHIPLVLIRQKVGSRYHDYELYRSPTISDV